MLDCMQPAVADLQDPPEAALRGAASLGSKRPVEQAGLMIVGAFAVDAYGEVSSYFNIESQMFRAQVCATSRFVFAISDGVLYVLRADVLSATPELSLAFVAEKHPTKFSVTEVELCRDVLRLID